MEWSGWIVGGVVLALVALGLRRMRQARGGKRKAYDPYVDGLKALVDGDRETAFQHLERAVRGSDAPVDAYLRLGTLLRESGEVGRALQLHQSLTVKTSLSRRERAILHQELALD
jgi:lipopolysaccharide biosynthesis regulator YciM